MSETNMPLIHAHCANAYADFLLAVVQVQSTHRWVGFFPPSFSKRKKKKISFLFFFEKILNLQVIFESMFQVNIVSFRLIFEHFQQQKVCLWLKGASLTWPNMIICDIFYTLFWISCIAALSCCLTFPTSSFFSHSPLLYCDCSTVPVRLDWLYVCVCVCVCLAGAVTLM